MAARPVHWLMLLETRFISAMGARVTRRAQPSVDTISGNSDRNGATHCTRKNCPNPSSAATASIDSRKGCAVAYSNEPPAANSPPIAARWRQPVRAGEVRDRGMGALRIPARVPGDHGFDGELRQGLQPGEDGERQALRDEELRGLRTPRDQERRRQEARKRPQRGQRGASCRGQKSE